MALQLSKETRQRLKIIGITAFIIGSTWYIHKRYKEYQKCIHLSDTEISLNQTQSTVTNDTDTIDTTAASTITDMDDIIDEIEITHITPKIQPLLPQIEIFTPTIKVHHAIHGLSKIELQNLTGDETTFQIELSIENTTKTFNFDLENIARNRITNIRYISCRLPVGLKDYFIGIRIRCKIRPSQEMITLGVEDNYWSRYSTTQTLIVPSSLISRKFNPNEMVTFVPEDNNGGLTGRVIGALDDDNTLYIIQQDLEFNIPQFHKAHCSRMYRSGPGLYNIVDICDEKIQNQMDMTVLLGLNEDHYNSDLFVNVFNVLTEIYTNYARKNDDDVRIRKVDHRFVGKYIAKNVMEYCSDIQHGEYNLVKCIMECDHGFMRLVNVWNNSVRNSILLQNSGIKYNDIQMDRTYSCDLCGIEISKYDYIYTCNTSLLDRHFFCLRCVWNMVKQHNELTVYLKQYLKDYLYDVCIEEISSFCVGTVVHNFCH